MAGYSQLITARPLLYGVGVDSRLAVLLDQTIGSYYNAPRICGHSNTLGLRSQKRTSTLRKLLYESVMLENRPRQSETVIF